MYASKISNFAFKKNTMYNVHLYNVRRKQLKLWTKTNHGDT